MELKLTNAEWRNGKNRKTGEPWIGLAITLQGTEKFTVTSLLFLKDTELQMLGLEKPKS